MGAIRREMNSGKWTAFAITYQCVFAYCVALIVYRIGGLFLGVVPFGVGTVAAVIILAAMIYFLVRPYRQKSSVRARLSVES
jgi:ferrous iron transport protein B